MRGRRAMGGAAVLLLAVGVAGGAIIGANPRESDEDASSEDAALGPAEDGLAAWAASLDAQARMRERDEREERERLARRGAAARAPAPPTAPPAPPTAPPPTAPPPTAPPPTAPPPTAPPPTAPRAPSTGLPSTVPSTAAYAPPQVVRLTDFDSEVEDLISSNSSANFPPPGVTSKKMQNEILQDQKPRCALDMEDAAGYVRLPGARGRYKFFVAPAPWAGARARCAGDGAHLAVANDEREALALVFLMRATAFPANPSHMHVGASDARREGDWRTEDGSEFNDTYFRWARNQPEINNRRQNCMQLYYDLTNVDFNCEGKAPFACEKSICPNTQYDNI
ncbi:hypothetical protein R5R35_009737 [Gryllus longicercus]|uniref:C-type lectin domain-containing protein n=1 Tax=Gryllus longicercus TaxID=2509291 RepID=A0AAN9ZFP5_9ORTH